MTLTQLKAQAKQSLDRGDLAEAARRYRAIQAQAPDDAESLFMLGLIAAREGRYTEAERDFGEVIARMPAFANAYLNLGLALKHQGRVEEAVHQYRQALVHQPHFAEAYNSLGIAYADSGRYEKAIAAYRAALGIRPDYAPGHNNLGDVYHQTGRFQEAFECYRKAVELRPDYAEAHSNLLFILSYYTLLSPAETLEAHREWDRRHGGAEKAATFRHDNSRDPERRLRIGYVSADLRRHAVSTFAEPFLRHHDPDRIEIYCYADVARPDRVTERLQGQVEHWRSIVGVEDEAAARQIHRDGIDILVDLGGHTAKGRLKIFTYKPAPVQATYIGYCTTTGLAAMDYWITDERLHPNETVECASEQIYRLPRCWLCYQPPEDAPAVTERPPGGPVVFGSLNNLAKLTAEVITCWSEIMHQVPGSRLLLKTRQLADGDECERVKQQFAAHGIAGERLILLPHSRDYLEVYGEIDIALDPFPRTGGATTVDSLWMGVPVVTLTGQRYIERQGKTMLTAVGLEALIAEDRAEYIAKAVDLARDEARRRDLRSELRPRMLRSELCDGEGMAAALELAYRTMWRAWCASPAS